MRRGLPLALAVSALSLAACVTIPKDALMLKPESLADRHLQTKVFETTDEKSLLTACASLLQDVGFNLDESEVALGVIVASRDRDVTNIGQIIAYAFLSGLSGVPLPPDKHQKVMASVVTKPLDDRRIAVRVTFQHMIWNTQNQISKNEQINDPKIYEEFFLKLSKAMFLQAHDI
jgi:hypothetical protein